MSTGKVYLVGAGPGDPGLMTVRGLQLLRAAQVVVYDQLVNPVLLEEAPIEAERIFVGKQAGRHSIAQGDINEVLVNYALHGYQVVRLKGGDPFVFGRGGEEVEALTAAGIRFRVIPGVTSGLAATALAGIVRSIRADGRPLGFFCITAIL
jgi:uroporphyrin-III C-methyltransferase